MWWLIGGAVVAVIALLTITPIGQIAVVTVLNQTTTTSFEVQGDELWMNGEINSKTYDQFLEVIEANSPLAASPGASEAQPDGGDPGHVHSGRRGSEVVQGDSDGLELVHPAGSRAQPCTGVDGGQPAIGCDLHGGGVAVGILELDGEGEVVVEVHGVRVPSALTRP